MLPVRALAAAWLVLILPIVTVAADDPRPIVAVFQIQPKQVTLEAATVDALTEYLAVAVSKGGVLRVVPPGDIRAALRARQKESYRACYDQKCQIELGRELAANKTLSASVLKLGGTCTLTASLYDLKTQATDLSEMADGACSPEALKASIDVVAARIRAWAGGKEEPAADARQTTGTGAEPVHAPPETARHEPAPPTPSGMGTQDPRASRDGGLPAEAQKMQAVFERLRTARRIELHPGRLVARGGERGALRQAAGFLLDQIANAMKQDRQLIFRIEARVARPRLVRPLLDKVKAALVERGVPAYRVHTQSWRLKRPRRGADRLILVLVK